MPQALLQNSLFSVAPDGFHARACLRAIVSTGLRSRQSVQSPPRRGWLTMLVWSYSQGQATKGSFRRPRAPGLLSDAGQRESWAHIGALCRRTGSQLSDTRCVRHCARLDDCGRHTFSESTTSAPDLSRRGERLVGADEGQGHHDDGAGEGVDPMPAGCVTITVTETAVPGSRPPPVQPLGGQTAETVGRGGDDALDRSGGVTQVTWAVTAQNTLWPGTLPA